MHSPLSQASKNFTSPSIITSSLLYFAKNLTLVPLLISKKFDHKIESLNNLNQILSSIKNNNLYNNYNAITIKKLTLEDFCVNIHGHCHGEKGIEKKNHINLASDTCGYTVFNLGVEVNRGLLSKIPNYHRITIDTATERKNFKTVLAEATNLI